MSFVLTREGDPLEGVALAEVDVEERPERDLQAARQLTTMQRRRQECRGVLGET